MILTPQQEELAPVIAGHLAIKDPRLLVIEGLSQTGKSTLVRDTVERMGKTAITIPEYSYVCADEYPSADFAVFEYSNSENVDRIRAALSAKVSSFVALAHPRFQDQIGLRRVDHGADLETAGFPARVLALSPMNPVQSRDYIASFAADPTVAALAEQYGLGIAGHIRGLLQTPELDHEKAYVLAGAKLKQILRHSIRYSGDGKKKVEALLGVPPFFTPQFDLDSSLDDSLEVRLASVPEDLAHRVPRFSETLEQYRQLLSRGASRVNVFVPELAPDLLHELGVKEDNELEAEGRIMRFSGSAYKAGALTPSSLRTLDKRRGYDEFSSREALAWLRGGVLQGLPLATEGSAYFGARTHGYPTKSLEAPLLPYSVETLLQAKGVSYVADYHACEGERVIRHFVGPEGVTVAQR